MHQIHRKGKITNLFCGKIKKIIKFSEPPPSGCTAKIKDYGGIMLKLFLNVFLPVLDIGLDIRFTYKCFKTNDVKFAYVSGLFFVFKN